MAAKVQHAIYGFGPGPGFLVAEEVGQAGKQEKKQGRGRPKGKGGRRSQLEILCKEQVALCDPGERLRPAPPPSDQTLQPRHRKTAGVTPRPRDPGATASRPIFYMIGKALSSLSFGKLPKTEAILGRLLQLKGSLPMSETAGKVTGEVVAVWTHHFGPKLILGKEYGKEQLEQKDKKLIMIMETKHIKKKILDLYKKWNILETESRRPDRSAMPTFKKKEELFKQELAMPFNITKTNADNIIKGSSMLDWQEETQYLHNQLSLEQPGCPGSWDSRQEKRDNRLLKAELTRAARAEKEKVVEGERMSDEGDTDDDKKGDNSDEEWTTKTSSRKKPKLDIMGQISLACDARNISTRDRTVLAAATVKACGIDIMDTNISKTVAWDKGRKVRLVKAKEVKDQFVCPEKVVVHWDGKTLMLRGRLESKRVCVYLSGVDAARTRKLLGIPEVKSGKGEDEFKVTKEFLMSWKVMKEQLVGMVFDTTSSNSGKEVGACKLLEVWIGQPILWLACRRHIAELHIGSAVKYVMGVTKDPGMALFRRLRDTWRDLKIDYSNLKLYNSSSKSPILQDQAKLVLSWAQLHLKNGTFPRDDYRELMELLVVLLGGTITGFSFKLPGPDHHARWMSKCLYLLKIYLLSTVFHMSEEELLQVATLTEFILLHYAKYWFTTALGASSARSDLDFMGGVLEYRKENSGLAWHVLQSCNRHLWYLTPQLIMLALADPELEEDMKEKMAKKLFSMDRRPIKTGKPTFPVLPFGATKAREAMQELVGPESWLIPDLVGLTGPQDWLLEPASTWHSNPQFCQLEKFAQHLVVVNDLAERGIHLASDYINRVESEEQRNALFQVVEEFRGRVTDLNKNTLKFV